MFVLKYEHWWHCMVLCRLLIADNILMFLLLEFLPKEHVFCLKRGVTLETFWKGNVSLHFLLIVNQLFHSRYLPEICFLHVGYVSAWGFIHCFAKPYLITQDVARLFVYNILVQFHRSSRDFKIPMGRRPHPIHTYYYISGNQLGWDWDFSLQARGWQSWPLVIPIIRDGRIPCGRGEKIGSKGI